MSIFLVLLFLTGVAVYLYIKITFNYIFSIRVKTIKLQRPVISDEYLIKKCPTIQSKNIEQLVSSEAFLRRLAYKNTIIKTNESFFNDSDMNSEYYLVIVYDKKTNTPLLSARYYFDKQVINRCLKGDKENESFNQQVLLNLDDYKEGELFLADRLSGNISSLIYRKYRNYIFQLFYLEIMAYNKDHTLILMARKEKREKLLAKYLRLGFNIVGSNIHKGKEHWVLISKIKNHRNSIKWMFVFRISFIFKCLFLNLKIK